jgi:Mg-chelatase subunit ChlD
LAAFSTARRGEFWQRDARPFGLGVRDGWVYHGIVNSAKRGQNLANLWAYVYASRPTGTAMRRVASTWLGHARDANHADWRPWPEDDDQGRRQTQFPHPMLTDIEFTATGNMILGLRDRYIDTGPSLTEVFRRAPGDIILARRTGEMTWEVEDLSSEEHYNQDVTVIAGRGNTYNELAVGGLARLYSRDVVVTTAVNPFRAYSDGAIWFDNPTGDDVGREELLYNALRHDGPQGKMQGLGDVEAICFTPPTPTPTLTPPPTPTATQTPRHTVTPLPTDTPTATPTPYRIYVPYGENECIPEKRFVDVVLVLDRSTSMLRSVEEGGLPKNEAAIAAARSFVDILALEPDPLGRHDQIAVVGFNDTAWTEIPLTNDRAAAHEALERIRTKTMEGTRLDLALLEGQKPLDGPERIPANTAILILLTDGLPNRVPFDAAAGGSQEKTVEAAADSLKAKDTSIYAIGLGRPNDIHPLLMLQIVTERYQYYYAPRSEDLEGIYRIIADTFTFCGRKRVPPPTPCIPEHRHADIILVLDTSTSMDRGTRAGRSKLDAALDAARTMAGELSLERDGWGRQDRLAIVGFNDVAWTELPLSDDRVAIAAALDALALKSAEGTRLDLALLQALETHRASWALPANTPTVVLLTDGLPNRVPFGPGSAHPECQSQECTVLLAATTVKAAGLRLFTIGLGLPDDVLRRLLEEAATTPRDYTFAPDGEDLAAIYRQIAGRVRSCP